MVSTSQDKKNSFMQATQIDHSRSDSDQYVSNVREQCFETRKMVGGVITKPSIPVADEREWSKEVLRNEWEDFKKLGQAYVITAHPQIVRTCCTYKRQTDSMECIKEMEEIALYVSRKNSMMNETNKLTTWERNLLSVHILLEVCHGFKSISEDCASILNVPAKLCNCENPDEHRPPPDKARIPYERKLAG